ncbi:GNAT family N-acetyltransferase [Paenarthrobacter sp. PH39-S1]|uniref:GNAT family N-acetyltransferase n=1 Tax=Micrococcaceae TaxID=1268 RepID=UPI0024BA56B2|nr:GNAT family N-acetyltransferase [Paenarthrobacter sp. PH39-S1]MDJ0355895.1 GNAT family N-acetyltransferase [Paenarthrobacter sp. PH39-S1]
MKTIQIEQLRPPDSLEGPEAQDLLASVAVSRQVRIHTWGNDDLAYTADEMLQTFSDPYEWYVVLLARVDGVIVGRAGIALPLTDNTDLAHVTLDVLPSAQNNGVGRELLAAAEQFVRGENRRKVMVETNHPASTLGQRDDESLTAADGLGYLPLSSREVIFARSAGYDLQQVGQFSACHVPLDPAVAARLKAGLSGLQGGDYALHQWVDQCPDRWAECIVALEAAMAADAAADGDDAAHDGDGQDLWTVDRLRETEALAQARGRHTLVTAVEELAIGKLVGFTSISVLGHRDDVVFQDDTIVLPEHRGKNLGMLIKVGNLELLAERFPLARSVYTWNVVERDYMIEVNRKLGFAPAGVTGQWKKPLGTGT